eukprot:m.285706 g.285706  ORF g.285706 m.285706 type:complete len:1663 (-) comp15777_c0_seq8:1654-6642(-)
MEPNGQCSPTQPCSASLQPPKQLEWPSGPTVVWVEVANACEDVCQTRREGVPLGDTELWHTQRPFRSVRVSHKYRLEELQQWILAATSSDQDQDQTASVHDECALRVASTPAAAPFKAATSAAAPAATCPHHTIPSSTSPSSQLIALHSHTKLPRTIAVLADPKWLAVSLMSASTLTETTLLFVNPHSPFANEASDFHSHVAVAQWVMIDDDVAATMNAIHKRHCSKCACCHVSSPTMSATSARVACGGRGEGSATATATTGVKPAEANASVQAPPSPSPTRTTSLTPQAYLSHCVCEAQETFQRNFSSNSVPLTCSHSDASPSSDAMKPSLSILSTSFVAYYLTGVDVLPSAIQVRIALPEPTEDGAPTTKTNPTITTTPQEYDEQRAAELALATTSSFAYAVKTSGTTGAQTSFVFAPHDSVNTNVQALIHHCGHTHETTRTLVCSPLWFDPSLIDIKIGLELSSTIILLHNAIKSTPSLFVKACEEFAPSAMTMTPSLFRMISTKHQSVNDGCQCKQTSACIDHSHHCAEHTSHATHHNFFRRVPSLQCLLLGGEPFPSPQELLAMLQPHFKCRIYNIYGITECSSWSHIQPVSRSLLQHCLDTSQTVPLGVPLEGTKAQLCATDDPDEFELHVGGNKRRCLVLTSVPSPSPEPGLAVFHATFSLWRRTGDVVTVDSEPTNDTLVQWDEQEASEGQSESSIKCNGAETSVIRFAGRSTNTIKFLGVRVTLEQIETTLMQYLKVQKSKKAEFGTDAQPHPSVSSSTPQPTTFLRPTPTKQMSPATPTTPHTTPSHSPFASSLFPLSRVTTAIALNIAQLDQMNTASFDRGHGEPQSLRSPIAVCLVQPHPKQLTAKSALLSEPMHRKSDMLSTSVRPPFSLFAAAPDVVIAVSNALASALAVVPRYIVIAHSLPLNANHKVDKGLIMKHLSHLIARETKPAREKYETHPLKAVSVRRQQYGDNYDMLESALRLRLLTLIGSVLGQSIQSIERSFSLAKTTLTFPALCGTSLSAVTLSELLGREFDVNATQLIPRLLTMPLDKIVALLVTWQMEAGEEVEDMMADVDADVEKKDGQRWEPLGLDKRKRMQSERFDKQRQETEQPAFSKMVDVGPSITPVALGSGWLHQRGGVILHLFGAASAHYSHTLHQAQHFDAHPYPKDIAAPHPPQTPTRAQSQPHPRASTSLSRGTDEHLLELEQLALVFHPKWVVDMEKCVDGAVALYKQIPTKTNYPITSMPLLMFGGSHSHRFVCVDASSGRVVWHCKLSDRVESSPCLSSCRTRVVVGCYDGHFHVLQAINGQSTLRIPFPDAIRAPLSLACTSPHVVCPCYNGQCYLVDPVEGHVDSVLSCLEQGGGERLRKKSKSQLKQKRGAISASPLVWQSLTPLLQAPPSSSMRSEAHETLLATACLGGIVTVTNLSDLTPVWTHHLSHPVFAAPTLVHGLSKLFVVDVAGEAFLFNAVTGHVLWSISTKANVFSCPLSMTLSDGVVGDVMSDVIGDTSHCSAVSVLVFGNQTGAITVLDEQTGALRQWKPILTAGSGNTGVGARGSTGQAKCAGVHLIHATPSPIVAGCASMSRASLPLLPTHQCNCDVLIVVDVVGNAMVVCPMCQTTLAHTFLNSPMFACPVVAANMVVVGHRKDAIVALNVGADKMESKSHPC